MRYCKLGKTGLEVSVIGLGCAQLGSSNTDYAVKLVRRAVELGINYFDTARMYWDSEIKLGLGLKSNRKNIYISSKTVAKTKEEALKEIKESLDRLQTDYLDNCHLHGLCEGEDLEKRLGPGGALEALIDAREEGLVRHVGCTSHTSSTLVKALERFDFEVILVPMNLVEREPLKELIPLCRAKGVGVTVMKPLATGLLPARLALKWLLNQPISTAVPGASTLEEVEEASLVGQLSDFTLTAEESQQVDQLAHQLDRVRCRLCGECEPCPEGIPISLILGIDVMISHYRNMGTENFRTFPWSKERIRNSIEQYKQRISAIQSCTECGECEEKCPYSLPIIEMLQETVESMKDMLRIWKTQIGVRRMRN